MGGTRDKAEVGPHAEQPSSPSASVDPDIGLVGSTYLKCPGGLGWETPSYSRREPAASLGCCGSGQILTHAPLMPITDITLSQLYTCLHYGYLVG